MSIVCSSACGPEPADCGLVVDRTSIDFGAHEVGSADPHSGDWQTVVVTNECPVPVLVTTSLTGSGASQFRRVASTCDDIPLATGSRCTVAVAFEPTSVGEASAALEVSGDDMVMASTTLTGTGLAP